MDACLVAANVGVGYFIVSFLFVNLVRSEFLEPVACLVAVPNPMTHLNAYAASAGMAMLGTTSLVRSRAEPNWHRLYAALGAELPTAAALVFLLIPRSAICPLWPF